MIGYCCIGFIDFLIDNEKLIDFASLFLTSNFEENHRKRKKNYLWWINLKDIIK